MTGTARTGIISVLCAFCLLSLFLTGCSSSTASTEVTPETLYADNHDIDMFVYEDTAWVNASDLDWVTELQPEAVSQIGEVENSGATGDFRDWDATVLKAGTAVYSCQDKDGTERSDLLLVEEEGNFTPYLKYVEG